MSLVENVRRAAVRFRKTQDERDRDRAGADAGCDCLRTRRCWVVRAFSYFSQLSNIAEDLHHNRRRRAHLKAGIATAGRQLQLALDRLAGKADRRGRRCRPFSTRR